ncbi:MAG: 3'-5' exonuclease, partial [Rickettsiaceae bacterium]|nr:3'-5' exonuclease [Rickettsiaceae bacterium]
AEVGNILKFSADFLGANIIALEQNYRSTQYILSAASSLIQNNNHRHKKTLWTEYYEGEKINIVQTPNQNEEAIFVVNEIKQSIANGAYTKDHAILVRASFQTRPFEEALIASNINYKIIGGLKFYERSEIKDILAYLRLLLNYKDDVAFERIVNLPRRSIGPSAISIIKNYAESKNISLFEALRDIISENIIKGKLHESAKNFVQLILRLSEDLENENAADKVIKQVFIDTGYQNMLKLDNCDDSRSKIENINELIRASESFNSIREFIEHISLVLDNENIEDYQKFVSIMTIHASKGLEFEVVFIPGMEDGIFPHQKSIIDSNMGLEEERRLAYVAITRAKKRLFLIYAEVRRVFNETHRSGASRFLAELPKDSVNFKKANYFYNNYSQGFHGGSDYLNINKFNIRSNNSLSKIPDSSNTRPGARVIHAKFGRGIVIRKESDNLEVAFDEGTIRTIKESFISCV